MTGSTYKIGFRCLALLIALLVSCAEAPPVAPPRTTDAGNEYRIGPGDSLNVFVWRNPDVSVTGIPVRPDGKLTTPLVEDLVAVGKTPTELARDIEDALSKYVRDPLVTVTVTGFVGEYGDQIRVVGEATQPSALPYRNGMTVLDVMIAVGGLTEFADGNKTVLMRGGEKIAVRLNDLLREGEVSANLQLQPGDVLVIPEAWF